FGGSVIQDFSGSMATEGGGRRATTGVGGTPRPSGSPDPGYRDRPIIGIPNLYDGRFDAALAGSAFTVPTASTTISTDKPTVEQDYESYSAFLNQRVGRNLHFEAGINVASEDRETNYLNGRDLDHAYIDVNQIGRA